MVFRLDTDNVKRFVKLRKSWVDKNELTKVRSHVYIP